MKNRYFQEMQRLGIKYRKGKISSEDIINNRFNLHPPYSEGQSFAYKFWAIAERYHATDVIVDALPCDEEIQIMLDTFSRAGIDSVIVIHDSVLSRLLSYDCKVISESKVYRRETELYYGRLEIIKGKRIKING